jgi:serine/threonine protein kinase/CheY-like chemotaxis protein
LARILIAEDYDDLRIMITELLVELEHDVSAHPDGATAMDALNLREFDLLILDWELPEVSGLDICKNFRARGGDTPILMLTGKKAMSDKERGFDAGADDYLTKPFHPTELKARIRSLLRRSEKRSNLIDKYGELQNGTMFAERYQVMSALGRGSTGVIYKALHTLLNRMVALKVLHPQLLKEPESVARFSREAQAVSTLSHPNIIAVHDFGITSGGLPYLVMDFADGPTLGERIRDGGPLHPRKAVRLFIQACSALAHAHNNGVIHRDVKPNNILLVTNKADEEDLKLVDFGIAKLPAGAQFSEITQNGDVLGSPLYMSPEQCMGTVLDNRTDIYSLGCVMYTALVGFEPFIGENVLETMYKRTVESAKPMRAVKPHLDLPQALDDIVLKALSQNLDERYQTMEQLKEDLEQAAYVIA